MSRAERNLVDLTIAAWGIACRHEQFGYAEIATGLHISLKRATAIVALWEREGAIQPLEEAQGRRRMFTADRDFVRLDKRSRSPEDNLWHAMRRLRSFSPTDLAAHSNTETVEVPTQKAADYCRALLAAGYLRVARRAAPAMKREAIYALARDTGPRPPREKRVRAVYDPNTEETRMIGGAE